MDDELQLMAEMVDEMKITCNMTFKYVKVPYTLAIDHRIQNTGLPVRSAVLKLYAGWLVVGWVTTSESQLLIVFVNVTYVSTRVMRYACAPILR